MKRGVYLGALFLLILVSLCYCKALDEDISKEEKKIDKLQRDERYREDSYIRPGWERQSHNVGHHHEVQHKDHSPHHPPHRLTIEEAFEEQLGQEPGRRNHKTITKPHVQHHKHKSQEHTEQQHKHTHHKPESKHHDDNTTVSPPPTPAPQAQDPDKLAAIGRSASMADVYFLAIVAGCSVAGLIGLVVAGVCWYRFQKDVRAASDAEYPAYGITGPNKERVQSPGDRKLAQSAQMYHYQHQKQQMIALEKANGEMKHDASDEDSEEENEEGDYTVYECPGLALTGEMEVKNPLFSEDNNGGAPGSDQVTHTDASQADTHSLK